MELLHGGANSHAENATVAHRDETLQGLVALAQGIRFGIQKTQNAGPTVGLKPDEGSSHRDQHRPHHHECPTRCASQKDQQHRYEYDQESGPKIRLPKNQRQGQ